MNNVLVCFNTLEIYALTYLLFHPTELCWGLFETLRSLFEAILMTRSSTWFGRMHFSPCACEVSTLCERFPRWPQNLCNRRARSTGRASLNHLLPPHYSNEFLSSFESSDSTWKCIFRSFDALATIWAFLWLGTTGVACQMGGISLGQRSWACDLGWIAGAGSRPSSCLLEYEGAATVA